MATIGLYAGSFDPITWGHIDIVKKALTVFDTVIVLVADDQLKTYCFTPEERVALCKASLAGIDRVKVERGAGLTAQLAKTLHATALVRGLRTEADFNSEFRLSSLNKIINPDLNTVFFISDPSLSFVSSTKAKLLFDYGADISKFVPEPVIEGLKKKRADKEKRHSAIRGLN